MSRTLLALAGVAVAIALPSLAHAQAQAQLATPPSGRPQTRTLICHGGAALQVRVHADPSPSWIGPASYPTKPVRMALPVPGGAAFTDAANLPAGSCAWKDWSSGLGAPPGEVFVDVNHPSRPAPNPSSMRADLADANRFYHFRVSLMSEPLAAWQGEWKPGTPSQAASRSALATAEESQPAIRQLMCRGGPSAFEFKVIADPSPAFSDPPKRVRLAIHYRVHVAGDTAELALGSMSPGSCGWDMRFGAPMPPGEVIIDIETDAQASNATLGIQRDTSMRAGLVYQDTTTLRRYLSDPGHFWIFYHPDRGEALAMSHGAHKPDLTNLFGGRVENARTTASGTRTRTGTTQGSTGSVAGSLRDAAPGSATLSSARVLPDSQARTSVVRTPNTAGSVAGPLRDDAPASVTASDRLPTDSVTRRTATVRTPTPQPTTTVAGPLRGGSSATTPPSTSRVMPTDTAFRLPEDARARSPRIADRRLSDVRTEPGPMGVRITFGASGLPLFNPHNWVRVEIEFEPPTWNERERRWSYPTGLGGHWFAKVSGASDGGLEAVPWAPLEPGRRYHYLITAFATKDLPEGQRTGSFVADIRTPLNGLFK